MRWFCAEKVRIEALKGKIFNFNENNENHRVYPSACGWEVIVLFVDIGGVDDHHCLCFLFINKKRVLLIMLDLDWALFFAWPEILTRFWQ